MKLLFVSEFFYPKPGGGEVWSWELCKALAKEGIRVTVLTQRHDDSSRHETKDRVIIKRPCDAGKSRPRRALTIRKLISAVKKEIKNNPPNVIHVNAYALNVPVSRLAKRYKIPCVTTIHSFFGNNWPKISRMGKILQKMEKRRIVADQSRVIHVPSQQTHDFIKEATGRETRVIEHWVPDKFPLPAKLAENTIVFVGSMEKVKNPLAVLPLGEKYHVRMVGSGSLVDKIVENIGKESLDIQVKQHLSRDEVQALLGGASLVVVPSLCESFSLVAAEAAAQGTPVSGNNVGIVRSLPGSIPFPPEKIPERLSEEQVKETRERFSKRKAVQKFIDLYRSFK